MGVFPADMINIQTKMCLKEFPIFFIANSRPVSHPGEHWVAFVNTRPEHLEIFDSYGRLPAAYLQYLARFIRHFRQQSHNRRRLQQKTSDVCGHYCLYYLREREEKEKDLATFWAHSEKRWQTIMPA